MLEQIHYSIPYPTLDDYVARLSDGPQPEIRVWKDGEGRVQGQYFNSSLTSAFQSIRRLDTGAVVGYQGFIRSYSESDDGLSLWKLLDLAANDDESIKLDRLCRMLHAINFFRQPHEDGADLYLSVHTRLLAAVDDNHGAAFDRILQMLDLPKERVVLQLPAIADRQGWLLSSVLDNYRRNGFRVAINAASIEDGLELLSRVRTDVIKVDSREVINETTARRLLDVCAGRAKVIFKRVEEKSVVELLQRIQEDSGHAVYAQGHVWDVPTALLAGIASTHTPASTRETQNISAG